MKNNLIINVNTGNLELMATVDDGTNSFMINGSAVPSSDWVGSGNYSFTVGGQTYTVGKAADLTGNQQLVYDSGNNYHFEAVKTEKERISGIIGTTDISGIDDGTLTGAVDYFNGELSDLNSDVGDLSGLTTTAKNDLVSAINEIDSHADTNAGNIGTLSSLSTSAKNNLVAAINEVDGHADTNTSNIGNLVDLSTSNTGNLVYAINEIYGLSAWGSQSALTLSLYHCTGTINGSFYYRKRADGKAYYIFGRVYINGFSRTGANPGVVASQLNLGSGSSPRIGFRGESPIESVDLSFSNGRITTSESFSNASGSRLTLMIPPAIVFV